MNVADLVTYRNGLVAQQLATLHPRCDRAVELGKRIRAAEQMIRYEELNACPS